MLNVQNFQIRIYNRDNVRNFIFTHPKLNPGCVAVVVEHSALVSKVGQLVSSESSSACAAEQSQAKSAVFVLIF